MKSDYTPDNTRSSIVVLMSSAVIAIALASLIGLSDKPKVDQILVIPGNTPAVVGSTASFDNAGATAADATAADATADLAEAMAEVTSDDPGDDEFATDPATTLNSDDQPATEPAGQQPERPIIQVPTVGPTPTPEVAAAVEPTRVPESDASADSGSVQAAPALPAAAGSVQGSFFTSSDENDGAEVAQNLISVSFAADGSGAFQGVLDITYVDGTHILLNMSGPVTFAPTNPQVEAVLEGAFTLDAPIAADNMFTDDAELTISSLKAGSGSLCTAETKCFGFTFPPQ